MKFRSLFRFICIAVLILFISSCASEQKRQGSEKSGKGAGKKTVIPAVPEVKVSDSGAGKKRVTGSSKTVVKVPDSFSPPAAEKIVWSDGAVELHMFSRKFGQGDLVYVEIPAVESPDSPEVIELRYGGKKVPLSEFSWGLRGFWGISPLSKTGPGKVSVKYMLSGRERVSSTFINVKYRWFPVSKRKLNLGKFSNRNYYKNPKFRKLIKKCSSLRRSAFATVYPDYITNEISHPRDMHKITGVYWKKRIYLSYKKGKGKMVAKKGRVRYHRGLDLKGAVGAPVYSMARGRVVLAFPMFFEGKMVVVNHGNGIFSYYMHLSKIKVKPGDMVDAGQRIGSVGSTGMSTASHLHVSLWVRGVQVDPLSLLSVPVRQ